LEDNMTISIGTDDTDILRLNLEPAADYGLGDDWVLGFGGIDVIYTGAGDDFLDGGEGADFLNGGDGNDTIVAGEGDDAVVADAGNDFYSGGSGTDILYFYYLHGGAQGQAEENTFGVTVDLAVAAPQDLGVYGIDRIIGFEDLAGGTGNDIFYGSSGANSLDGYKGDDALYGRAGNDRLEGGDGADTLVGGTGKDLIRLGTNDGARDIVRYLALNESGTTFTTRDDISDFVHGQDKIDLKAIDADISQAGNQAFRLVQAFTGAFGEVVLTYDTKGTGTLADDDTYVYVDGARNTGIDMMIRVISAHLTKADLIL
jgi:Ca2+-binding RTX toxin-like protein